MNKKLLMMIGTATLIFSIGTVAFASAPSPDVTTNPALWTQTQGYDYSFMCDENGNLLSRTDFVDKLDKAIKDGSIKASDKEDYLRMYDRCNNYMYGNTRRTSNSTSGRASGRSCCR